MTTYVKIITSNNIKKHLKQLFGVGGGLKMYVVHAAPVQLTFYPPRKNHVLDPRGDVQLPYFHPPRNVSYIFCPPPTRGLRGWG